MTAVLLGVLAALAWSVHDVIARRTAVAIGPFRMGLLIMLIGAVLLAPYALWTGRVTGAGGQALVMSLALGVTYGLGGAGLYKAFSLGPISLVAPLTAGYPLLVVFWGVLQGLRPDIWQWSAVAIAIAGALLVARAGQDDGGRDAIAPGKMPWLLFYCVVSGLGFSAAVVLGQKAAVVVGEFEAAWVSRLTALPVFLLFMWREARPPPLTASHWLALVAMAVLDGFGLVAVNMSGHYPGKEYAAVGIASYAAMSVVLAALLLRERVAAAQWAGIGLIVAGVATVSIRQ